MEDLDSIDLCLEGQPQPLRKHRAEAPRIRANPHFGV